MVEMSHIKKVYRTESIETHALEDLSLTVGAGEFAEHAPAEGEVAVGPPQAVRRGGMAQV